MFVIRGILRTCVGGQIGRWSILPFDYARLVGRVLELGYGLSPVYIIGFSRFVQVYKNPWIFK